MAHTKELALRHWDLVLKLLAHLGCLVNLQKSDLIPTGYFQFLGLQLNTLRGELALTQEETDRLWSSVNQLLAQPRVLVWDIQKFFGRTNFAAFAVPVGLVYSLGHYSQYCLLTTTPHVIISDIASFLQRLHQSIVSVGPTVERSRDALHCDNHTAVTYVLHEVGTHSPRLMALTQELLHLVDRWDIMLHPCYLPGVANIEPDALSHNKSLMECCIQPWELFGL